MADKIKIDFADRQNLADIILEYGEHDALHRGNTDEIIDKIITYLNSIQ